VAALDADIPVQRINPDVPHSRPATPPSRQDCSNEEHSLGTEDTPSFNMAAAESVELDIMEVDGRQGTPASVGAGPDDSSPKVTGSRYEVDAGTMRDDAFAELKAKSAVKPEQSPPPSHDQAGARSRSPDSRRRLANSPSFAPAPRGSALAEAPMFNRGALPRETQSHASREAAEASEAVKEQLRQAVRGYTVDDPPSNQREPTSSLPNVGEQPRDNAHDMVLARASLRNFEEIFNAGRNSQDLTSISTIFDLSLRSGTAPVTPAPLGQHRPPLDPIRVQITPRPSTPAAASHQNPRMDLQPPASTGQTTVGHNQAPFN